MSDKHYQRPGSFHVVAVAATVTQLLAANVNRRAVVISNAGANVVVMGTARDLAVGAGLVLPITQLPVKLCCCDLGSLITQEWLAIASGGSSNVAVAEVMAGPGEDD